MYFYTRRDVWGRKSTWDHYNCIRQGFYLHGKGGEETKMRKVWCDGCGDKLPLGGDRLDLPDEYLEKAKEKNDTLYFSVINTDFRDLCIGCYNTVQLAAAKAFLQLRRQHKTNINEK